MAPSRTELPQDSVVFEAPQPKTSYDINVPYHALSEEYERRIRGRTEFPEYLPVWEEGIWHDDFPEFEYHDPALRANKKMPNLFSPGVTAAPVTPRMGTILSGVKMETLSPEAKDELALLICQRKFVVLREQSDFLHKGPQYQVDFMSYFGKLSQQPVTGAIKGFPQFHVIHRDGNEEEIENFFKHKMTTTIWHHDVSYERQPPGYVMLGILACPDIGGDTIVADMGMAYKRLSPIFQEMINQLTAVHTSRNLIAHARRAKGVVRADPIDSTHPVVRVHPVTGERALFYNMEWPEEVIGLKDQEADVVMKFLMDFVRNGHDFQARVHWEKHSVVMFDNRTTLHTGTVDYDTSAQARHLFRLCSMCEVPISVADYEAGKR
ncbi:putative alpha-ketoglutarate-dependent sulfonate dioxygenase [Mollisia scopiformis]|uniref:Putative alpha-ketoglutarate-dependent sulfonate dioxygenase n=1 Tax=Mollisia scopiformis TaxID=149040 RepID=A0A194XPG8_MOLSC|nr:putative alpha-ketoglutarate-dependent sulfonate dioxygenase [Mollisia scopiformis]KUJ22083.1 putative alpha-ketoglutarate-dependent sulfonate dioxygenase [Mollisia scopiformis]